MAGEEGLIRDECLVKNGLPLDEEELKSVQKKQDEYYATYWHRIIMPFLQYRQPYVANQDEISMSTLKPTKDDPIYFHVAYVKPGRTTYVV